MQFYLCTSICAVLYLFIIVSADAENSKKIFFDLKDDTLKNITFHLSTRYNPVKSEILINGDLETLLKSPFNFTKPVKIYLHGFEGNVESLDNYYVRNGFLIAEDCNMISVNWEASAAGEYEDVVGRVPHVSLIVASFIDWLNAEGVPFKNIHLVGFSMGGQLSGFTARNLKRGRIDYLTVLDPANKIWEDRLDRVNKEDANYVEVIHTDTHFMGIQIPVGHADFYPNGGALMVGCDGEDGCSHLRSCQYFAETLGYGTGTGIFTGEKCASYEEMVNGTCTYQDTAIMGGLTVKDISGIYHLVTNEEPPYSKG